MKTMMFALAAVASFATQLEAAPELPKEIASLQRLVGEWTTRSGTATVAGKPAKLEITVSCATTPNKLGVLCQSRISIEGMGTVENTDLFGYDPGSKTYHWYCVAGFGEAHDHVGKPAGKGFSFTHQGPDKNGKLSKEVITMGLDDRRRRGTRGISGAVARAPRGSRRRRSQSRPRPARASRRRARSTAQLAGAYGLGGRERRSGAAVERARQNVRRRIADAMHRIAEACPALGRHLEVAVRTGTSCVYKPSR